MRHYRNVLFASLLLTAALPGGPALVAQNCTQVASPPVSATMGSTITWTRMATDAMASCDFSSSQSAVSCYPGPGPTINVSAVVARFMTSAPGSAFCQWFCDGNICRVRRSDGMPVELMDFAVEEAEEAAASSEEGAGGGPASEPE